MVAQLVEDRVHLEGRGDRLDEDGGLDRAALEVELLLGDRGRRRARAAPRGATRAWAGRSRARRRARAARARCGARTGAKSVKRAGHRLAVRRARWRSGRCSPRGRTSSTAGSSASSYCLPPSSCSISPRTASARFDLAADHVAPGGRVGVLEVRHEPARAGVERVDDHLAAGGPGDLHAPVLERVGHGRDREVLGRRHEARAWRPRRARPGARARRSSSSRRRPSSSPWRRASSASAPSVSTSSWRSWAGPAISIPVAPIMSRAFPEAPTATRPPRSSGPAARAGGTRAAACRGGPCGR